MAKAKTVRELIEYLQELDPDLIVGIASDAEGNDLNEWAGEHSLVRYEADQSYGERFTTYYYDDEGDDHEYTDDECNAVILWPV